MACAESCMQSPVKKNCVVFRSTEPKVSGFFFLLLLYFVFNDYLNLNCKLTDFTSDNLLEAHKGSEQLQGSHTHCPPCFHYLPAASLFTTAHEVKVLFFNMCLLLWRL